MINLKDVTLMIHFRRDVDQRLENLHTVVNFYRKHTTNLDIIIVNDDNLPDPALKSLNDLGCTILFQHNEGIYHRTRSFNAAAKESSRKYLIAGDTDVFINPIHIQNAIEIFEQDEKVGVVLPYNGMFVHLKQPFSNQFHRNCNVEYIEQFISDLQPIPYWETDKFLVAHPMSKGGSVMFSREAFVRCNGYNQNFIGWGFEDDEILNRYTKFGFTIERVKEKSAIAWHLPHDNTIREKHPFYNQNYYHSEFVGHASKEQLEEYIKTWKL